MPRLKHPTIPNLEREVTADQVEDWKDSGWLDIRAKGPESTPKTPAGDDG